jgi:hypothetical protein
MHKLRHDQSNIASDWDAVSSLAWWPTPRSRSDQANIAPRLTEMNESTKNIKFATHAGTYIA